MGVLFPKVRGIWVELTRVGWFGLLSLVHFGLGGCGETLGFSGLAYGVNESRDEIKFGVWFEWEGCGLFPFWLRLFKWGSQVCWLSFKGVNKDCGMFPYWLRLIE